MPACLPACLNSLCTCTWLLASLASQQFLIVAPLPTVWKVMTIIGSFRHQTQCEIETKNFPSYYPDGRAKRREEVSFGIREEYCKGFYNLVKKTKCGLCVSKYMCLFVCLFVFNLLLLLQLCLSRHVCNPAVCLSEAKKGERKEVIIVLRPLLRLHCTRSKHAHNFDGR